MVVFKPLNFGVLCYTAIKNWNNIEKTEATWIWCSLYRQDLETKAICEKRSKE